ncbi:hypothetical protein T439DRAFT_328695 [Meredithblackwellia eburnea MCA 4105]
MTVLPPPPSSPEPIPDPSADDTRPSYPPPSYNPSWRPCTYDPVGGVYIDYDFHPQDIAAGGSQAITGSGWRVDEGATFSLIRQEEEVRRLMLKGAEEVLGERKKKAMRGRFRLVGALMGLLIVAAAVSGCVILVIVRRQQKSTSS